MVSTRKIWISRKDIESAIENSDSWAYSINSVNVSINVPPRLYPPTDLIKDDRLKNWLLVSVLSDADALTEINDQKKKAEEAEHEQSSCGTRLHSDG